MARFCANEGCVRSEHPLSRTGGPCPACGSAKYRLDPDRATVACPTCDQPNLATDDDCWDCGESLRRRHHAG